LGVSPLLRGDFQCYLGVSPLLRGDFQCYLGVSPLLRGDLGVCRVSLKNLPK